MKYLSNVLAAGCFALASASAFAHGVPADATHSDRSVAEGVDVLVIAQTVVPEAEKKAALEQLLADGPTKTSGIAAVNTLGAIALDGEFEDVAGRILRTREIVFEPGGVVAVHRHEGRPGIAYILEGEIVEYRVDVDGQSSVNVKKAGDFALESTGVVHWWRNESGGTVRALVVDLIPAN